MIKKLTTFFKKYKIIAGLQWLIIFVLMAMQLEHLNSSHVDRKHDHEYYYASKNHSHEKHEKYKLEEHEHSGDEIKLEKTHIILGDGWDNTTFTRTTHNLQDEYEYINSEFENIKEDLTISYWDYYPNNKSYERKYELKEAINMLDSKINDLEKKLNNHKSMFSIHKGFGE